VPAAAFSQQSLLRAAVVAFLCQVIISTAKSITFMPLHRDIRLLGKKPSTNR
jgi:hypothetical protein